MLKDLPRKITHLENLTGPTINEQIILTDTSIKIWIINLSKRL